MRAVVSASLLRWTTSKIAHRGNTRPAKAPAAPATVVARLALLGQRIRAQRKGLGVSATALAESAGLSRLIACRIECGVPSVTMGGYLNALAALGMDLAVVDHLPPADVPTCRRAACGAQRLFVAGRPGCVAGPYLPG